jgi:hypothetical protein
MHSSRFDAYFSRERRTASPKILQILQIGGSPGHPAKPILEKQDREECRVIASEFDIGARR